MKYWNGVLAAHSSPWKSIGTNGAVRTTAAPIRTRPGDMSARAALAQRPIAHLIVVLEVAQQAAAVEVGLRPTVTPLPKRE